MWLAFPIAGLVVLLILGAIIGGGIFTIVLVPVAVLVVLAALVFSMWSRAQNQGGHRSQAGQTGDPLPHSQHSNSAPAPNTPGDLVNARQEQQ